MKALRIIGFIFVLCLGISAQQTAIVSGRVLAGLAQIPVQATVVIKQNGREIRRTTSDAAGMYRFEGIPSGDYKIVAEFEQRVGTTVTVEKGFLVSGNSPVVVDFALGQHISQLYSIPIHETVTVSAGQEQKVEQVSKTVDVIDGQEMRDRADFSLIESLRTIPGFRVQQSGGFGRLATIKTRGLRNQDTAILLDGIRFRDVTAITGDASAFLSDFTLTSVGEVEVLRGSGSSIYGTNSIGGTIDFQTPTAKSGTHGQVSGTFGGLGLRRFRGNISHGTEDGKFGITAGVSQTQYTSGIDGQDQANNTNLQTRFDASLSSKTSVSGRIFWSNADVRLNSDPDTKGALPPFTNMAIVTAIPNVTFVPDANDPDNIQHSRFFSGQVAINHVFNSELVFSGYYQGLTTKRKNTNGVLGVGFQPFGRPETTLFDGQVHTVNGHFNWRPDDTNEITAGYEFELEKFSNDGLTTSATPDFSSRARQSSHTFYVQELAGLMNGRLQLAGGFRAQFFSLSRATFTGVQAPYQNVPLASPPAAYTFDGAASYFVEKTGTKFRAHVGNGYRVPSLYERFGAFYATFVVPNRFVPIGAPNLKPERSVAFDAGIEQTFAQNRARVSATYFYTVLSQTIGYGLLAQPDPFGRVNGLSGGGYLNNKGGIARGVEFSGTFRPTISTNIFTSYTFTNSDQRAPQVSGSGILKTLGVPDHQFTLVTTQRYKRFWVNFDFLATSTYLAPIFSNTFFNTYIYRFQGNRKGDLTGGYTFGFKKEKMTLRVYGTIENVFDQDYYENGFRTFGRTARAGLSFGF